MVPGLPPASQRVRSTWNSRCRRITVRFQDSPDIPLQLRSSVQSVWDSKEAIDEDRSSLTSRASSAPVHTLSLLDGVLLCKAWS